MRPFPLLGSVLVVCVSTVMAHAAGSAVSSRAEPEEAQLPAVDPAWRARGWHAVVPHAYVLRKLLAVRTAPAPDAPIAFHLKGGTRVPVVEQGQKWWRVTWTHGRSGWVPALDVEPHAAVVLLDTHTGKVTRRLAAKGQWGAVSDGKALWSIADTGITRTSLGERPEFWSRKVAAGRDAVFPNRSLWGPERSSFYLRAVDEESGALLRADVATGEVRTLGTPPLGTLVGQTRTGDLLLRSMAGGKDRTHLYSPQLQRTLRRVSGKALAISRSGITYLQRDDELIRTSPGLQATRRVQLPTSIMGLCLSADQRYVAASYELSANDESRVEIRIMDAASLRTVVTLKLPQDNYSPYVHHMGTWSGGWWIAASGEGNTETVIRFRKSGKVLRVDDGGSPVAVSADEKAIFLANDEQILALNTATGTRRTIPLSWRRKLPTAYLPKPSAPDFPTHLVLSSLTLTPDGKTLIITEWLSGDPEG